MGLIQSAWKVVQKNAYLFSDTTKINENKKWKADESIGRSVPDMSVQVVEKGERLRRNRPAKEMSFKFFCRRQMEIRETEKLMENNWIDRENIFSFLSLKLVLLVTFYCLKRWENIMKPEKKVRHFIRRAVVLHKSRLQHMIRRKRVTLSSREFTEL